jgi:phenylacetate-CoA ligase
MSQTDDNGSPTNDLRQALRRVLPALAASPFYQRKFAAAGLSFEQILSDGAIAWSHLPLTSKAELVADQHQHPPFGSTLSEPLTHYVRLHQTSGTTTGQPLRWLDTPENWLGMLEVWESVYSRLGLRPGQDRLFFPFSFGPFLGFWTAFDAAQRLGFLTLPGGGMSSVARLRFLLELDVSVLFCTPTYALRLAEVARGEGLDLRQSAVRYVIVAGEPGGSIPATRQLIESAFGARLIDHYGLTEVGPIALELLDRPGTLAVHTSHYLVEVLDPQTLLPVLPGQVGELIVTNLRRPGCPLLRYRTGDLVRPAPDSPTQWLGGILGRTDEMIHLRGNNVYPSALEGIIRRFDAVSEYRLELDHRGPLTELRVVVEPRPGTDATALAEQLARVLKDELLFRVEVVCVEPGTLERFEMKAKRIVHVR